MLKLILPPIRSGVKDRYAKAAPPDHFLLSSRQTHSFLTRRAERPTPVSVATLAQKTNRRKSAAMNRVRTAVTAGAISGSMLIGGVAGIDLYGGPDRSG